MILQQSAWAPYGPVSCPLPEGAFQSTHSTPTVLCLRSVVPASGLVLWLLQPQALPCASLCLGTYSVPSSVNAGCWENPIRAPTVPKAPSPTPRAVVPRPSRCCCGSTVTLHSIVKLPVCHPQETVIPEHTEIGFQSISRPPAPPPGPDSRLCSAPPHHLPKSHIMAASNQEEDEERQAWL